MLNYEQFKKQVTEQLSVTLGGDFKVKLYEVFKTNDTKRCGVNIFEKHDNIAPTIYLEEFYQRYKKGEWNLQECIDEILNTYYSLDKEPVSNIDLNSILEWDFAKEKICLKLISKENNKNYLKDIVFKEILDLAMIAYIPLHTDKKGTLTVCVRNKLMYHWGISQEEVFNKAMENTEKLLPPVFIGMREVVEEIMFHSKMETHEDGLDLDDTMFVLTNERKDVGAITMLYEGMLEKIADTLADSLVILPSSIHETIILRASNAPTEEELIEMITDINNTQVNDEEVLSYRPYYYDRERKILR